MLEGIFSATGRGSRLSQTFDGDGDLDGDPNEPWEPLLCVTIVIWGIIGFDSS